MFNTCNSDALCQSYDVFNVVHLLIVSFVNFTIVIRAFPVVYLYSFHREFCKPFGRLFPHFAQSSPMSLRRKEYCVVIKTLSLPKHQLLYYLICLSCSRLKLSILQVRSKPLLQHAMYPNSKKSGA